MCRKRNFEHELNRCVLIQIKGVWPDLIQNGEHARRGAADRGDVVKLPGTIALRTEIADGDFRIWTESATP
jgi:hypothetical protein